MFVHRWASLFACLATCEAMRSTSIHYSGHLECSSVVRAAPATRKDPLLDHEKGDDWHLIAIVNGYMAGYHSTTEHLAERFCEASFGASNKSLIAVLESNLGPNSVEPIEVQGRRAAKELKELVQWNRQQGRHFSGYSLVGHSLGGLVARVVAAEMSATGEPLLKPRVFISMFSPHAGVESFTASHVIPTLLNLARLDKGASSEVLEPDANKSILVRLASGSYAKAFRAFDKRVLYGSPSDWLVDLGSSVLSSARSDETLSNVTDVTEEYPLLHIRSFTPHRALPPCTAAPSSVRCRVLTLLQDVPIERVQLEWSISHPEKHSQKDMTLSESLELTRHMAGELGSSFALPHGAQCGETAAATLHCASALECRHGICQPQLLDASNSCLPGMLSECQHVISVVNDVLKQMTVIVTSSGGGGHLVAAKSLQEALLEEAESQVQVMESVLSTSGQTVLTAEAQELAKGAIKQVQAGKPAVEMLDLMSSGCTNLAGFRFGGMMSEQWNQLQRAGDIKGLKRLVTAQPLTQIVFGAGCRQFMRKVCEGQNLYRRSVTRLYTTQPLLLESLLDACSSNVQVDLFMTDLPTTEAVHFFQPLKSVEAKLHSVWRRRFYLHSLPPAPGGRAELERLSGVPQTQIYLEKFMPVNRAFTKPEGLPTPGETLALKLKSQLPLEEEFLKELGNPLLLLPEDEVMLVMLGSQPTASAVAGYAQESLKLPAPSAGKRYVLLACGKPKVAAYAQLYTEMVHLARENAAGGPATVLVPFTGQDAKEMLGRADVTITRSGGMTAGELLALRTRKDDLKKMLLHVESVPDTEATKILAKHLQNKAEKDALAMAFEEAALEGMVPWEAGNARYLMTAVNAKVVVPKIFVSVLNNRAPALPFSVDWRSLLYLRGFGGDEIAFATAPPSCKASCQHGFSDLPVTESVAGGSMACLEAMKAYDGKPMAFHLAADVAANRKGRLINSHSCGDEHFLVRQRPSKLAAVFFNIDSAAQRVVSSCGGKMMTCGNFVVVQLPQIQTK